MYSRAAVARVRTFTAALSATELRTFASSRMHNDRRKDRGRAHYLDPVETIESGAMQTRPSPVTSTPVCSKFFSFVLNRSNNFFYQPGTTAKDMVVDLGATLTRATPKEDAVVQFMAELSQYYQLSPDSNFIFLPFPSRRDVHAIMNAEAPPALQCKYPYFLKTWRTNPLIAHIKLGKHLCFALCDTCVEFREAQQKSKSHKELLQLKAAQLAHHQEVKRERQKYYVRRDKGTR